MNKDTTKALEAGIYAWITDNKELVELAQELSLLTVDLGLCDTSTNNPFQIVPSDEFSSDGNLKHELFLNIDHPAWGYFKIIINSLSEFKMIPPRLTLLDETIYFNKQEVINFIEYLSSTLDDLYELQKFGEEKDLQKINILISKMLYKYHDEIDHHLSFIKKYINTFQGKIFLKATNSDDMQLLDTSIRYDLALMHPENWHVKEFYGIQTLENAREELKVNVLDFFITESQAASFLYVAQKLLKELGFKLIVYTDSKENESDVTGEVLFDEKLKLTLVRPVIHCNKIEVMV